MTDRDYCRQLRDCTPPEDMPYDTYGYAHLLHKSVAFATAAAAIYDPPEPTTQEKTVPPNSSLGAAALAVRNLLVFIGAHHPSPLSLVLSVSTADAKIRDETYHGSCSTSARAERNDQG